MSILYRRSVDSPVQLKHAMASQYGEQLPDIDEMEIGYFHKSNKLCIKSRLDINDVWGIVRKGEKVTLWCVGALTKGKVTQLECHKCLREEGPQNSANKFCKGPTAEEKRAATEKFERKLRKSIQSILAIKSSFGLKC